MAFRLKLKESAEKGFRRVGIEQIERAQRELQGTAGSAIAIHEARKCLKRMRALLRLFRPGLGDTAFRSENARYREIGAGLAQARDSHVLTQTVLKLETLSGDVTRAGLTALRRHLQESSTHDAPPHADMTAAVEKLQHAEKRFRRLKLSSSGFEVVQKGLESAYRKALKAFDHAFTADDDEAFHEWRKTVQQHWRHMALVSRAWPDHFASRVTAARALSQLLGEDHDLALLVTYVRALPSDRLPAMQVDEVARLARARQVELRSEAGPRGRQLFAEGAKGHGRRVAAIWQAAEELGSRGVRESPSADADPEPREAAL